MGKVEEDVPLPTPTLRRRAQVHPMMMQERINSHAE